MERKGPGSFRDVYIYFSIIPALACAGKLPEARCFIDLAQKRSRSAGRLADAAGHFNGSLIFTVFSKIVSRWNQL